MFIGHLGCETEMPSRYGGRKRGCCSSLFGQTVLLPSFRRGWGRWSAPTRGKKLKDSELARLNIYN